MSKLTPGWQRTSVLEAVFDQLSDALILYDPDFRITGVNRAAEKLFGVSSEEMLGRRSEQRGSLARSACRSRGRRRLRAERPDLRGRVRGEPLKLPDGSECWVTVHPSFLLRIPEAERKRQEKKLFLRDLKRIKARAADLRV